MESIKCYTRNIVEDIKIRNKLPVCYSSKRFIPFTEVKQLPDCSFEVNQALIISVGALEIGHPVNIGIIESVKYL